VTAPTWTVARKIALIVVALVVPTAVLLGFTLSEWGRAIESGEKERAGVVLLRPLVRLQEAVGRHQGLIEQVRAGQMDEGEALLDARQAVGAALNDLDTAQARHGAALQITYQELARRGRPDAQPAVARRLWEELVRDLPRLGAIEVVNRHEPLRLRIREMIDHVGETSNLVLDPDLDSYSLMNLCLQVLPDVVSRLNDLELTAGPALRSDRPLTSPQAGRFLVSADHLRDAALDRATRDIRTAVLQDPLYHGARNGLVSRLEPASERFAAAIKTLADLVDRAVAGDGDGGVIEETPAAVGFARDAVGPRPIDPVRFHAAIDQARQATLALANTAAVEFDGLLERRVGDFWNWRLLALVATGLTLAMAIALAWFVSRSITRPLARCVDGLEALAGRDLTHTLGLRASGEPGTIAAALDHAVVGLRGLIGSIQQTTLTVMAGATESAATARQQQRLAEQSHHATHDAAVAVTQITSTGRELVHVMHDVHAQVGRTAELASAGRLALSDMEQAIIALSASIEALGEQLDAMRQRAEDINLMVVTIIKVADETNLLSINAAIEAEKAGAAGRGFAVVAREVRRLADQTAIATLDIERAVAQMQASVAAGDQQMETVLGGVHQGVAAVHRLSDQLSRIIAGVQELDPRFLQVHDGMTAQTHGAEQIREVMVRLNDQARQTDTSLQEFHRASEQLRESILGLNRDVAQFRLPGSTIAPSDPDFELDTGPVAFPAQAPAHEPEGWADRHDPSIAQGPLDDRFSLGFGPTPTPRRGLPSPRPGATMPSPPPPSPSDGPMPDFSTF
jgi:methyl-accepting chemotaxis protein